MSIDEAREKFGIVLTIRLFQEYVGPKFFASMNFDDWVEVAMATNPEGKWRQKAIAEMINRAETDEHWRIISTLRKQKKVA